MEQPKPPSSTDSEAQASSIRNDGEVPRPSLLKLLKVFLLAGGLSFGGGAVAYLREYLVTQEHWLDDEGFLGAMEIGETLPGLIAVNTAIIVGDNLRGLLGALAAVIGMLVPGSLVVMTLGILWRTHHQNPLVMDFLEGVAAAAVGMLSTVVLQVGRKQFRNVQDFIVIIATFSAVSLLHYSLLTVLLTIGLFSIWMYRPHVAPERNAEEHVPFHRGPRHYHLRR
ncbi:MAG TPA: chromate transporter [Candidatus Binataceae bacterium]|nr:chromate transporter [Candidatus Binataceae bacterium]